MTLRSAAHIVGRMPAGTWQIDAVLNASLGSCGGEQHPLTASVIVRVEP